MTGYLSESYIKTLAGVGTPCFLEKSGGWILKRTVPGTQQHDAMGAYPLFCCRDWSQLAHDLENLDIGLVSLAVVTDPFGDYDLPLLQQAFQHKAIPFKTHFIIDTQCSQADFVASHHQRNARKAMRALGIERCENPLDYLDDWVSLYSVLVERHHIRGIAAFSRESFESHLQVPGLVMFRAAFENKTVGILLWYQHDDLAYYHLGAYNERGYEMKASFGLFWLSLEYFHNTTIRWLNLGAGAGLNAGEANGLTRFKQGWSTDTRTAYFCGRVFDMPAYERLVNQAPNTRSDYFPAYRAGEFG